PLQSHLRGGSAPCAALRPPAFRHPDRQPRSLRRPGGADHEHHPRPVPALPGDARRRRDPSVFRPDRRPVPAAGSAADAWRRRPRRALCGRVWLPGAPGCPASRPGLRRCRAGAALAACRAGPAAYARVAGAAPVARGGAVGPGAPGARTDRRAAAGWRPDPGAGGGAPEHAHPALARAPVPGRRALQRSGYRLPLPAGQGAAAQDRRAHRGDRRTHRLFRTEHFLPGLQTLGRRNPGGVPPARQGGGRAGDLTLEAPASRGPQTRGTWPVTALLPGCASQATAAAATWGWPPWLSAFMRRPASRRVKGMAAVIWVSMKPGATALMV